MLTPIPQEARSLGDGGRLADQSTSAAPNPENCTGAQIFAHSPTLGRRVECAADVQAITRRWSLPQPIVTPDQWPHYHPGEQVARLRLENAEQALLDALHSFAWTMLDDAGGPRAEDAWISLCEFGRRLRRLDGERVGAATALKQAYEAVAA